MKLSIITINFNNREGLKKTADSVLSQFFRDFEWILIDGGGSDGSGEFIAELAKKKEANISFWCSEPDKGIYNAMNKGILHAQGEYCLFLNSGDYLFNNNVLETVFGMNPSTDIFYGNFYTDEGKLRSGCDEDEVTCFTFMDYSIHHTGCAFIRRNLFEKYGLYDETLKIVSDWKWLLQAVGLGRASVSKLDIVLSVFDTCGISSIAIGDWQKERQRVIGEIVPPLVYRDYKRYYELLDSKLEQEKRIRSSWAYKIGAIVLFVPHFLIRTIRTYSQKWLQTNKKYDS